MITKFDSLFAGHTDLDNIGYGGTPINERRYPNTHLATALSKAEAMATLMDGLGYNCFWMAEHHFQPEALNAFPTPSLWHCTSRTERRTSRLVAASISLLCGTRCGWRRTSPPLTSSPAVASSLASVAATTRARWKRSAPHCATRRPIGRSLRSRSISSLMPSTTSASRIRASTHAAAQRALSRLHP